MIKLFIKWTDWLHDGYEKMGSESVSAFRVFYAFSLLITGPSVFTRISNYSPELYKPNRSLAIWFDLPSPAFFQCLDWLVLVLLILILFGAYCKWSSLLLGFVFIVGESFLYSFGKIDHGNLLITFVPLIMAFSNWDAHFSIVSNRGVEKKVVFWPVSMMAFIVGFGMLTAGFIKLIKGWLDPSHQAIKFHIFKSYLNLREGILTDFVVQINSLLVWEAMDYLIVLFEIGLFIAVFWKKWFERWIMLAVLFHIGVLLILDISFSRNVIAYFLFLDWFFILHVVGGKRILEIISNGFNLVGLVLTVVFFSYMGIYHGTPYIIYHLPLGKYGVSIILFGLAIFVMVGSMIYKLYSGKKSV